MRGRNNNRRSSNPLTRVYESNGPDVKVRGTAHHIAEKYQQLARDAQSSGDPVAAENYLQHAEHYLRIIAAVQGQFAPQAGYGREDEGDDDDMDDVFALDAPQPSFNRAEPYAARESQGREMQGRDPQDQRQDQRQGARDGQPAREGRGRGDRAGFRRNRDDEAQDGQPREGFQPREPREYRSRNRDDAGEGGYAPRSRQPRDEAEAPRARPLRDDAEAPRARPQRDEADAPREPSRAAPSRAARAPRVDEEQPDIALPSFITGGPSKDQPRVEHEPAAEVDADAGADPRLGRRRRRFRSRADRAEGGEAGGEAPSEASGEQSADLFE